MSSSHDSVASTREGRRAVRSGVRSDAGRRQPLLLTCLGVRLRAFNADRAPLILVNPCLLFNGNEPLSHQRNRRDGHIATQPHSANPAEPPPSFPPGLFSEAIRIQVERHPSTSKRLCANPTCHFRPDFWMLLWRPWLISLKVDLQLSLDSLDTVLGRQLQQEPDHRRVCVTNRESDSPRRRCGRTTEDDLDRITRIGAHLETVPALSVPENGELILAVRLFFVGAPPSMVERISNWTPREIVELDLL